MLEDDSPTVLNPASLRHDVHLADATFRVQGREFKAHRAILAAASSYFLRLFTSGMREATPGNVVALEDMDASIFEALLDHIYLRSFKVSSQTAVDVLIAADRLQLSVAKEACAAFLSKRITRHNVWDLADVAQQCNCQQLQQGTRNFLMLRSSEALASVANASETAITQFLRQDIVCTTELALFQAALVWVGAGRAASAPPSSTSVSPSSPSDAETRQRRLNIVLPHIRFPTMAPRDLLKVEAENVVPMDLLLEAYRWAALDADGHAQLPKSARMQPRRASWWHGVQHNIPLSELHGWTLWSKVGYMERTTMPPLQECPGHCILIGSINEVEAAGHLHLAAMGEKRAILEGPLVQPNAQTSKGLRCVNGVYWYTAQEGGSASFGFSADNTVCLEIADTMEGNHRLSWHMGEDGRSEDGYRSGEFMDEDTLEGWVKVVYYMGSD